MDGWEFAWNNGSSKNFQPVRLPHDWAINRPFDKTMEEGRPRATGTGTASAGTERR